MFKVNSRIKIDTAKLNTLSVKAYRALEMTGDALLTEVKNAQVMPFDTGNLQNESTFVDHSGSEQGRVSIVSSTPYARRLYFHPEYNFSRKENGSAGAHWFRFWLPGGTRQNFCAEAFAEIYRRLTKL